MNPFDVLKKYFNFNKRERNGIIILLSIILILVFVRIALNTSSPKLDIKITYLDSIANSIDENDTISNSYIKTKNDTSFNSATTTESQLFVFDPNKITEEQSIQLGFSKKMAKMLLNYCSKGGKFRQKEDLKKLYGFSDKLYQKLEPYILIETIVKPDKYSTTYPTKTYEKPIAKTVELNSADSTLLVSLNGIGPAFARKIIKFRNALGGFYDKKQLLEVYGMKDTLYQRFEAKVNTDISLLKKININTATFEVLKKHPYINHTIASTIISYRSKHGNFKNIADLKSVGTLSDEVLEKLKYYLEY